jgi:hypothetical protein
VTIAGVAAPNAVMVSQGALLEVTSSGSTPSELVTESVCANGIGVAAD